MVAILILTSADARVLDKVADDVFDDPIDANGAARFFADPRHVLAVALDGDLVVGMISSVEYAHPDKPAPELWINEVCVAASHHRQGIARRLLTATLDEGRRRGCAAAWVLTDRSNEAAMGLYASAHGAQPPSDQVMFDFKL